MPIKYLPMLLLLFALQSCATGAVGSKSTEYGTTIEVIENNATASIKYTPYSVIRDEKKKEAETGMWSKERINKSLNALPKGGMVTVDITGITIDQANTANWEYIITTMDDKVIRRVKGERSTPEYTTSQYGTTWWNTDIIFLSDNIKQPFKFYAVDKITNHRSGFIIRSEK